MTRERCGHCGRTVGTRVNAEGDRVAVWHHDREGVFYGVKGGTCSGTGERTVEQMNADRRV